MQSSYNRMTDLKEPESEINQKEKTRPKKGTKWPALSASTI